MSRSLPPRCLLAAARCLMPSAGRTLTMLAVVGVLAAGGARGETPALAATAAGSVKGLVVFQTDFGVKDGAVSEMKGVAYGVDPSLKLSDLTHEIPAFNIWEASYRLWQTAPYWPAGTVFVSVVDPGVGTARKSVVAHLKTGQYVVTPDNGTLTLVAEKMGIDAVRQIDETKNRRAGSEASYTFHGRDVYAYTGARLAAGVISFEGVGPEMDPAEIVTIRYTHAQILNDNSVGGSIPVLDPQYGNVWTNIAQEDFDKLRPAPKPGDRFKVMIFQPTEEILQYAKDKAAGKVKPQWDGFGGTLVFKGVLTYANSFGGVPVGQPLLYINSLMNVSFAINEGNFAATYHVEAGPLWRIYVRLLAPGDDGKELGE